MINKNNDNLNVVRMLGIQAVNKANSGHPGAILGAAPIIDVLFNRIMKHNAKNPKWFDRDRFVLSIGHGSGLLYSAFHLAGYDVSIDDLKKFRQLNSKTAGHPERHLINGIEVTTGPLGQGLSMGIGMGMAESHLANRYNKKGHEIINHYTYILCGDGDLQEGISQESISFAGTQQLNKVIVIHDSNDVQLDDFVSKMNKEDMHMRFQSALWNTIKVEDGENLDEIEKAIKQAHNSDKPTYIEVKTIIGLGATKQGTSAVHGSPLGDDIQNVYNAFGWDYPEFTVPNSAYDHWQSNGVVQGAKLELEWNNKFVNYQKEFGKEAKMLLSAINQEFDFDFKSMLNNIPQKPEATRISSGNIFKALATHQTQIFGGSADLSGSTKIAGIDGEFNPMNRSGRNVLYGVREFAMGAMNNGIAAHGGLLPISSGFFVFADYIKPAMRLTSIMGLQHLFIFTHDSIAVGEDGPTHEPIEQLAMIRAIPNHVLIRPADFAETVAAYDIALNDLKNTPTTFALTRQDLNQFDHSDVFNEVRKGAYILKDAKNADVTLFAAGSEVGLAMSVQELLQSKNINARVISVPSFELFEKQSEEYKKSIIDQSTLLVSIEMGSTFGWNKFVGLNGLTIGIDTFGESAPANDVIKYFGFTKENISSIIEKKLKR